MNFDPEQYKNPQCGIYIDGSQLKSGSYHIESVNVQISAGMQSNSCEITLTADYDSGKSSVSQNLLSVAAAGKKAEIKLGYEKTDTVFLGYINTVSVSFSADGILVALSCLDARGLLMGNTQWQSYENEKMSRIITDLLKSVSSFTGGIDVSVSGEADKENPLSQNDMDDYQYICSLARLTGSSFCMLGKKLIFGKNILKSPSAQTDYEWGRNLLSFSRTVDLSSQIGSVTVYGNEPDTINIFSSTATAPSGSGKTAAQLCAAIREKTKETTSKTVKNQDQAKLYAESLMFEGAIRLCTGSAQVLGNEKLMPGGRVRFQGLDPSINGDYVIISVAHSFGSGGFLTNIEFARTTA